MNAVFMDLPQVSFLGYGFTHTIYCLFFWSQFDGGNIEQRKTGYGCHQNQEAKLKTVGGAILRSNQ